MNQLFLLKLIADLIKSDKPTVEEIKCARTIVSNLIEAGTPKQAEDSTFISGTIPLDMDADAARRDLME